MPQQDPTNPQNASDADDFGSSDTEFNRGQLLDGRYKVLSLLGRGGMGVVYEVEQIFLGQKLALKTIEKRHLSKTLIRRFRTEAKAAFAVAHPNIVGLYDFGILEDQTPYIAMELIEGQTLAERLRAGALSVEEAIPIFVQICFGLAHAHSCGVIHRDIKPSNIMLLANAPKGIEGGVKILDFGVAKIAQQDGGEIQALTRTGEIFGSPLYVSPEQCSGTKVDHRSDVYSLGCVLFEALTGTPPYIGDNALATMMLHQSAPIPTLSEGSLGKNFPVQLEKLVRQMLAKNPEQRIQNLGEAAHALGAINHEKNGGESLAPASNSKSLPKNREALPRKNSTIAIARESFILLNALVAIGSIVITTMCVLMFDEQPKKLASKENASASLVSNSASLKVADAYIYRTGINKGLRDFETRDAEDTAVAAFEGYPDVQSFIVKDGALTDEGLSYLKDSKVLVLKLVACNIKNVDNLCHLTYVNQLDLQENPLAEGTLQKVAVALKQLKTLTINSTKASGNRISENNVRGLAKSHSLTHLEIAPNQYSQRFIQELHELLPQCAIHQAGNVIDSKYTQMLKAAATQDQIDANKRLLALAAKGDPLCDFVGQCHMRLSNLYGQKGDHKLARAQALDAYEIFRRSGDLKSMVAPLITIANYDNAEKRIESACAKITEAFDLIVNTSIDNNPTLMPTLQSLCVIPSNNKNFDLLLKICEKAVDINQRLELKKEKEQIFRDEWLAYFAKMAGLIYVAKNDLNKAKVFLRYYYDAAEKLKTLHPKDFCCAQILLGVRLDDEPKVQKSLLDDAVQHIEKMDLKQPEDNELQIHYLDACTAIAGKEASNGDLARAIVFMRKALTALPKVKESAVQMREKAYAEALVGLLKQTGNKKEAETTATKYGLN